MPRHRETAISRGAAVMTRSLTLTLPEEVYLYLELRAAKDNDRITTGVERFLTELVLAKMEKRPVQVVKHAFRDSGREA